MTKSELKSGMVVKTRDGNILLVVEIKGSLTLVARNEWNQTTNYCDDLKHEYYNVLDIMEVYDTKPRSFDSMTNLSDKKPIWVRKPKKKMTVSQIEKELGYEIEIVRKD